MFNYVDLAVLALMIFLIVVPPHLRDGGTRNSTFLSDFKEGLQFVRKNKAVFESTVSATLLNFFATMVWSFFVVYVSGHLMESGTFFGFLVAALGLGIAGGSLVVGRLNTVSYAGYLFIISSIGFGLTTILLASTRSLHLAVIFVGSMGVCLGLINTTFFSVMQLVVPNEILGRVLSVDEVGSFASIPLGQIVAGLVISGSGIAFNYLIAGTGIILTAIAMMFLKDLRNFRYVPTS